MSNESFQKVFHNALELGFHWCLLAFYVWYDTTWVYFLSDSKVILRYLVFFTIENINQTFLEYDFAIIPILSGMCVGKCNCLLRLVHAQWKTMFYICLIYVCIVFTTILLLSSFWVCVCRCISVCVCVRMWVSPCIDNIGNPF